MSDVEQLQPHIPVLLGEVLDILGELEDKNVVDGTFGAGGYSKAFLERGANLAAFDRDPEAIERGRALFGDDRDGFRLVHAPFSTMADHFDKSSVDAVVLDVGVSSMQFDQAGRGFSFRFDGPLDMRMGRAGPTAADVVNTLALADLIRVIGILGEEKQASRIAKAIDAARKRKTIEGTLELAGIIETASPRRHSDTIHPATRTFQALRIFVNDELRQLARALFAAELILRHGGILAVVSFHSLEDRLVKQFLASRSGKQGGSRHMPLNAVEAARFAPVGRGVIAAGEAEIASNPRARSAKLRAAKRLDTEPLEPSMSIFKFARLPWLDDLEDAEGGLR